MFTFNVWKICGCTGLFGLRPDLFYRFVPSPCPLLFIWCSFSLHNECRGTRTGPEKTIVGTKRSLFPIVIARLPRHLCNCTASTPKRKATVFQRWCPKSPRYAIGRNLALPSHSASQSRQNYDGIHGKGPKEELVQELMHSGLLFVLLRGRHDDNTASRLWICHHHGRRGRQQHGKAPI